MTNEVHIRRPQDRDCDALSALCFSSKQANGYDDAFMAACKDELTVTPEFLHENTMWIAEQSNQLVGCVSLCPMAQDHEKEISLFFVAPNMQRQGVGRVLWHCILNHTRDSQITTLILYSDPNAVEFYHALGFVQEGFSPSGSIPGRVLPVMKLVLVK